VTLVSIGEDVLFNSYLPSKSHEPRRTRLIEDVCREFSSLSIQEGRYYLKLDISGEVIGEGIVFKTPIIKYIFAKT
jgi:hypothetical protein